MEQNVIRFYLWDAYVPDLLVRIHNSPGIWGHQPSPDTEHWTVGSRKQIMHTASSSHWMLPAEEQNNHWKNCSYHSSHVATWITQKRDSIPKNQTGSFPNTVSGEMLHSPILWPIMENLSHCRAEGANFTDHQPASQSYHTSRARFDLKWMTSLLCLQCRKTTTESWFGCNYLYKCFIFTWKSLLKHLVSIIHILKINNHPTTRPHAPSMTLRTSIT